MSSGRSKAAAGPEARLRRLVEQVRAMAAAAPPPVSSPSSSSSSTTSSSTSSSSADDEDEVAEATNMKENEKEGRGVVVGLVQNIPPQLRSLDLRLFFSDWIERKKFRMFHYLHRPEVLTSSSSSSSSSTSSESTTTATESGSTATTATAVEEKPRTKRTTCCCVVQLYSERDFVEFKRRYHQRHWTDRKGAMIPSVCVINKVKPEMLQRVAVKEDDKEQETEKKYLTRRQRIEQARHRRREAEQRSLADMPELHPPKALLPQGNVGTPLRWIQDRVRECAFPSSLIKELGIHDLRRRKRYRRYGEVHYDYGQGGEEEYADDDTGGQWEYTFEKEETTPKPANRISYKSHLRTAADEQEWAQMESRDSEGEQDAEEWERHEALQHDDHEEYLYEQDIELQWEKGGSGLVFWTDGVYWDAQNDGKEADQFDLDTAHYYDEKGGDDDNLYGTSQNQYDEDTKRYYRGGAGKKLMKKRRRADGANHGHFERYTRGFGSRILKAYGWEEGQGVGSTPGIPTVIKLKSQMDTAGLGYGTDEQRGSKRKRHNAASGQYRRRDSDDDADDDLDARPSEADQSGIPRPQQRRVIVYTAKPRVGENAYTEQLRRWRMGNDPSYITIGTVYDHPHTNPLLPFEYYDNDEEVNNKEREEHARSKQEEEERYRSVALRRVFHSKPFVRGGTFEEAQEGIKKSDADSGVTTTEPASSSPS